jgi:hypothetical protein
VRGGEGCTALGRALRRMPPSPARLRSALVLRRWAPIDECVLRGAVGRASGTTCFMLLISRAISRSDLDQDCSRMLLCARTATDSAGSDALMECCAGLQLQLADCRILLQYTAALRLYDEGDAARAPSRTYRPQPTATVAWLAAAIKARTSLWSVWSAYSGAAYVYSRRVWACDWATPSGHSTVAIGSNRLTRAQRCMHCTALHCTALHCTALHCALGVIRSRAHACAAACCHRSQSCRPHRVDRRARPRGWAAATRKEGMR